MSAPTVPLGQHIEAVKRAREQGIAEGRQLERAAIVADLRTFAAETDAIKSIDRVAASALVIAADKYERADHLRPDSKDGEGK